MSAGKNARFQSSIINRPTCGGSKKAGTAPQVGWRLIGSSRHIGAPKRVIFNCLASTIVQNQRIGYAATHSGSMG